MESVLNSRTRLIFFKMTITFTHVSDLRLLRSEQAHVLLLASPLALLGAVRLLSATLPVPERDSIHRAGGSPWGVGLLLMLILVMVSYQSKLQGQVVPARQQVMSVRCSRP
jgi:hypothetical protein